MSWPGHREGTGNGDRPPAVPPDVGANEPEESDADVALDPDAALLSDDLDTDLDAGVATPAEPAPDSARVLDRAHAKELFNRFVATRDPALRSELVGIHMPLVEYLARRFRNRGEPLEDLVQVGTIGLLKAIDRFDLGREVEFSTYATPTVVGELKRHFRDKGWAVRVPRRLQELNLSLNKVIAELSQEIGRSPTIAELAAKAGISEEEVLEGLDTANAYAVVSLDAPAGGEDAPAVSEHIGVEDDSIEALEYRASLGPLIAGLPERERRILFLRFFGGMTQSQIAVKLGISQMHVSRLLNRTLSVLREGLLKEDEPERSQVPEAPRGRAR